MREIKYRGKSSNRGKWINGTLIDWGNHIQVYIMPMEDRASSLCLGDYISIHAIAVDHKTVGQFIGKLDMDGKEIYEGDILEIWSQSGECFRGKVVYDENLAAFTIVSFVNPYGVYFEEYSFAKLRVVGNIWDDAELLEENIE